MDTGIDFQAAAKALVPNEFRPVSDKESWGQSLLTSRQFLQLLFATLTASTCGLLLCYSFYVTFILSSVEAFPSTPSKAPRPPIAGSYRRTMKHILSSYGWRYFISGAVTFVWTALFAYIGRWALHSWAFSSWTVPITGNNSSTPTMQTDSSVFTLFGGPDMVSGFLLEPLSVVFTHRILTHSGFSSFGTLKRIARSQELYISLIYIGTVRMVTTGAQSALMVTDPTQHYARPFATAVTYISLFVLRIVLITRAHASLLPPTTSTTVDISQATVYEPTVRIWQWFSRTLKMFKLLFTCAFLATLYVVSTLAGFVYASGHSEKVIAWAYRAKQAAAQGRPTRDPGLMMAHDPELDPRHFH